MELPWATVVLQNLYLKNRNEVRETPSMNTTMHAPSLSDEPLFLNVPRLICFRIPRFEPSALLTFSVQFRC